MCAHGNQSAGLSMFAGISFVFPAVRLEGYLAEPSGGSMATEADARFDAILSDRYAGSTCWPTGLN